MSEIGVGIVGTGMIGKVHAEAIQSIPNAKLVAVCGRNPERTKSFADKFGATAYTDLDQFLAHPNLQLVSICTPNGMHLEPGACAAQAAKHVIVEKPIEINLARADELISACDQAGVKLGVIYQSRFLADIQRIKQAIEQNKLGRLMLCDAYVKWYRSPEYYADSWHGNLKLDGGGALINQAIHTVDLLQWIVGLPETVFAMKGSLRYKIEGEDTLVATMKFPDGALGVIEAATSVKPGYKRRLEISGEKGTIVLDGDVISVWDIEGDDYQVSKGEQLTDGSANPAAIATEGHRRQIEDMVKAIIENRDPVVTGREGRKSLELVEAIYRSADSGQPTKL
ncbi:MAG TPA: Gfo/Idh/MocA family oxidoreductase [Blastocatellia bacterium]|nr:Gfo/Idh/MocA family oxidoreductase [Blastocatellia bacterium]